MKKTVLLGWALLLLAGIGFAQEAPKDSVVMPRSRTSPIAIAAFKRPTIYLKVVYGQPLKREREVFGALEPYGQVWRTGANEATEITTTKDVKIGGKTLKAGTYALFSIPNKDKWTVIFNSELGQWGAFKYEAAKNVVTVDVPVATAAERYEAFTIKFTETPAGADMVMAWDKTKVVVPFAFAK